MLHPPKQYLQTTPSSVCARTSATTRARLAVAMSQMGYMAHFGSCIWLAVSQMTSVYRLISVFVWSRWVISEIRVIQGRKSYGGGSPSMAKRPGLAANPDHPGPEHPQQLVPHAWATLTWASIKAHSTVSIASHNMHGAHTPLTSAILLQGSPNRANSNPEGYIWYLGNISKQIICPEI